MPEQPAIRVLDVAEPELVATLGEEISAFNFDATGIRDGRIVFARADGADGGLRAAIHGWTWGATGWVEHLWVRAEDRGRRLGAALLRAFEAEARAPTSS